jgi:hypothetical protein
MVALPNTLSPSVFPDGEKLAAEHELADSGLPIPREAGHGSSSFPYV